MTAGRGRCGRGGLGALHPEGDPGSWLPPWSREATQPLCLSFPICKGGGDSILPHRAVVRREQRVTCSLNVTCSSYFVS